MTWYRSDGLKGYTKICYLCLISQGVEEFKQHPVLGQEICGACRDSEFKTWYFYRDRIIRLQKGLRAITISIN